MNKATIRFSYPTLPDLTPRGIKHMFCQAGYALVERRFHRADTAYAAASAALEQSTQDYNALEAQLLTLTVDDLAVAAKNRGIAVAGYELIASDGYLILEWAILDAEYARLNIEHLTAEVTKAGKARRMAEARRYYWQVLRDRA